MNSSQISLLLYCGVVMITAALGENSTSTGAISASNPATNENTDKVPESDSTNDTNSKQMSTRKTFSNSPANNDETPRITSPANTKTIHRANTIPPNTTPTPTRNCLFEKMEGGIVLMVMGGLVVLCTVLLVCTLALSCQVCHLKRHCRNGTSSRPTRSNIDLVSAGHWGTSQRAKERPGFDTEIAEASPLIAELKQSKDGEGRAMDNQGNGKDTTAEDTPKTEGGEAATAKGSDRSTSNGAAGPTKDSSPSKENLVLSSKQPAAPAVTIATSTTSTAPSDAVVVVG